MGGSNSKWENITAADYLMFLFDLFGRPDIFMAKRHGLAIWTKSNFTGKTIFGQEICFDKCIIKDESIADSLPMAHNDFIYIIITVNLTNAQLCSLSAIIPNFGYDTMKKNMWIRCDSLDTGIAGFKILTDYMAGAIAIDNVLTNYNTTLTSIYSATTTKVSLVKSLYTSLVANIATINSQAAERFQDPWYGESQPYYASNDPGDVALGETEEAEYYRNLKHKSVAYPSPVLKSVAAISAPSAPVAATASMDSTTEFLTTSQAYSIFHPKKNIKLEYLNPHDALFEQMQCDNSGDIKWCHQKDATKLASAINAANTRFGYDGDNSYNPFSKITLDQFGDAEHLTLLRPDAHAGRLENAVPAFLIKNEYLLPNAPLSFKNALQMFSLKKPEHFKFLNKLENLQMPINYKTAVGLFKARKGVENLSNDPRFVPYNTLINYQIGSNIVDIDRVYGTVAQKQKYPQYADLLRYGAVTISDRRLENFISYNDDQFNDSTVR